MSDPGASMRTCLTFTLLALLVMQAVLPRCARADVTVDVPDALGLYIADQTSRSVLVDFGGPLRNLVGLRVHWRGVSTLGTVICGGYTYDDWSGVVCAAVEDEGGPVYIANQVLEADGAFERDQPIWPASDYAFLEDGLLQLRFYLENVGCADFGTYGIIARPRCTLEAVSVTAATIVPVDGDTWGAVKSLYGR